MQAPELLSEKIHQAYQRLMTAIFGIVRQDPQIPLCYPYIIENGEKVSLEEGVNKVLETLSDFPFWPRKMRKNQWTKDSQIRVLSLRFGLEDGQPRTLKEIGDKFNVTKERIRQVETRSLRVLRHPSRSKLLKRFLIPTPKERSKDLQRFRELEETNEIIGTTNRKLEEEVERLKEENRKLEGFLRRWGISPEEFGPENILQTRHELWEAFQRVALHYPGITPELIGKAYNALVRNGINSLSQLRVIMSLGEWNITSIRNLGEKSLWLIKKALEMIEEETS